ncbi:MAG: 16S rRNA (cytidine(1402)-2'-O)-methyltransferase [Zetaproteobacteria bacterium CG_4_9_14_3_um_filter_49_83]|nr:MAG: 16S rRNA (cytidine(1402)-2'-O)-methyltransferase [Zetaproteobacteria bacterium CG1_02_49_23]PIQ34584.1 MAG: 16S rRNA (cytidine(1402)-2'-O)-methyltransferase [Zetaproteobacteria bacterium CG17_big_fil_post_rev_8_21_14_2_50_50_13]PIV31573.1 MAG: 16S rRNA (cytidine(1402)-2'-O)-methyltransferase [Zetaproteobacteria bacterium CG02_land_8_20_14_3_00_50_9]PIY54831.1 MAG: 16S rRNA (cytidine(1402)-2'-O)-methyltransferase [Zetaproteobacteria bacterium CG_4_10_14_0_8_um_filter_49_80]PJA35802.1 MAG
MPELTVTSIQQAGACLFVVATPIGNLADMSYRAVETLQQAAWIAAEDTRTSKVLLKHYGIDKPLLACHEHNEEYVTQKILSLLEQGQSVALISDAGTPLINDPGFVLVKKVRDAGFVVCPIPGPSSPIAALCASGLPTYQFTYLGFPPRSGSGRAQWIQALADVPHTVVALESPKRLMQTLMDIAGAVKEREICVAREITKLHESFVSGGVSEVLAYFEEHPPRGEIVLMVGPAAQEDVTDEKILAMSQFPGIADLPPSARAREIAKKLGVTKSRVYSLLLKL